MLMEAITVASFVGVVKVISGFLSAIGILFGVFKVINWIKSKLTSIDSNVVELKQSMSAHVNGLRDDIQEQTKVISHALGEQRADMRSFYLPFLQTQLISAPVKAKPQIKRKKKYVK
jgi:hypothetical protein